MAEYAEINNQRHSSKRFQSYTMLHPWQANMLMAKKALPIKSQGKLLFS
jgi:hypothetical protein